MAIRSIELTDFTAFAKAKLEFSPGINVLIGENATGKTHAMKAVYALVRAAADSKMAGPTVGQKLALVFRPDEAALGRLGHRRRGQKTATLRVHDDRGGSLIASINTKTSTCRSQRRQWTGPDKIVFMPSREGLAMYEGFIAAYQARELSFDETYFDLAVALSATGLRGALPKALQEIGADLEDALGGKVVLKGARFYVRGSGGSMLEAPLVSEGMRKLASVLRLLQNGELRETGLLLWDEPEANLNPKLIVLVARILARLASNHVQVILATHDYLLVETLALLARKKHGPSVRFFSFVRDGQRVTVESGDSLDDLENNAIRDEFLAHYDRARGVGFNDDDQYDGRPASIRFRGEQCHEVG